MDNEAKKLMKELEITIAEVEESAFYHHILKQLQEDDDVRSHLTRVLGKNSCFKMVIYALGGIEGCYRSQYQFALAMLLRRDFPFRIIEFEAYDPAFSLRDTQVMEACGCNVIRENEFRLGLAEKPTLFYMPFPENVLVWNLFNTNRCPSHLNQMVVLSNPLEAYAAGCGSESLRALIQILVRRFELPKDNGGSVWEHDFFENFSWHFLDPCQDMEALLPGRASLTQVVSPSTAMRSKCPRDVEILDTTEHSRFQKFVEREYGRIYGGYNETMADWKCKLHPWSWLCGRYRVPCKYRQQWCLPPQGCIKLNFSARQLDRGELVQFGVGGVIHSCYARLVEYFGNVGDVERVKANAVALKQGIICARKWINSETMLVVEGDDLSFIRYVNGITRVPDCASSIMEEINEMLVGIDSPRCHVDEEANCEAIKLANKGAELNENCFEIDPPV